jgi:hypothetical protein
VSIREAEFDDHRAAGFENRRPFALCILGSLGRQRRGLLEAQIVNGRLLQTEIGNTERTHDCLPF